jgi:hypothetical protein
MLLPLAWQKSTVGTIVHDGAFLRFLCANILIYENVCDIMIIAFKRIIIQGENKYETGCKL